MKISRKALSDLATQIVYHALDGGFSNPDNIDVNEVEKVELAAHIKRSLALGKKRIVFDIALADKGMDDGV